MSVLSCIGHVLFSWLERQEMNYLRSRMKMGKGVDTKKGLRVTKPQNISIGDYVSIGPDVIMQAHAPIKIGEHTLIAAGVTIVTAGHEVDKRGFGMRAVNILPVHIGKSCWIGAGAIVLPGVTIGDGAVVGAGSVVTRDLPAEMICVGIPARPIKPRPTELASNESPRAN